MRSWIDPILAARCLTEADVAAGIQSMVLHRLVRIPNREIRLARGEYDLEGSITDGVSLNGQEGVVLTGRPVVNTEGVRFVSLNFLSGMRILGGSVMTEKCQFTNMSTFVQGSSSLVIKDCRIFGVNGRGITCAGKLKATRCIFEETQASECASAT